MKKNIKEVKLCPECGSDDIYYNEKKQLICKVCGLIYEPVVSETEKKIKKARKTK